MATHSRLTGWKWTAFLLGSLWVAIGCNPATLTGILMPFSDDRVPPVCPLAKKKEVTVCVVTNFAGLETRLETAPAANELAELFALQLRKRAEENREKIKVLAPSKTRNYAGAADFTGRTLQDIGKQCKADYVVSLEIASMDVYERKSSQMLYRGTNFRGAVRATPPTWPRRSSASCSSAPWPPTWPAYSRRTRANNAM